MKKIIVLLSLLFTLSANANKKLSAKDCLYLEGSIVASMVNAMVNDLNIPESSIALNKTILTLISEMPIDAKLADQYTRKTLKELGKDSSKFNAYRSVYLNDNVRTLIVKYQFENNEHKKDIFIGSALINDNECSVDFPGYIIVKREF